VHVHDADLAKDWVATAPTPARAHGTTAPTDRNLEATATPHSPVAGSAATMENVRRSFIQSKPTR